MFLGNIWLVGVCLYLGIFSLGDCGLITPREMDIRRANQMDIKKRPFCNAFTGCGKKRSLNIPISVPQYSGGMASSNMGQDEEIDSSLSDLIDLNAEPAVEDLMRQIMSQAKLWEAIQEASREISNQKNGHLNGHSTMPISFNAQ